jgi:hemoglobin
VETLFERVGGLPFFVALVKKFYEAVEHDPILRPIYPDDLEPGKAHLSGFLAQYWGGPPQYSMERGHPRLRMRHASFAIRQRERDAWVDHLSSAVRASDASPIDAGLLIANCRETATFLMNRPD